MLQLYQNHVVFQSFSDLYHLEQRSIQTKARKEALQSITASSSNQSPASTPTSSRAPSLFHELSRSSSNASSDDANSIATIEDGQQTTSISPEAQFYPAGLYNSSVERRLVNKESDMITLNDAPMFQAGGDLALRRF